MVFLAASNLNVPKGQKKTTPLAKKTLAGGGRGRERCRPIRKSGETSGTCIARLNISAPLPPIAKALAQVVEESYLGGAPARPCSRWMPTKN